MTGGQIIPTLHYSCLWSGTSCLRWKTPRSPSIHCFLLSESLIRDVCIDCHGAFKKLRSLQARTIEFHSPSDTRSPLKYFVWWMQNSRSRFLLPVVEATSCLFKFRLCYYYIVEVVYGILQYWLTESSLHFDPVCCYLLWETCGSNIGLTLLWCNCQLSCLKSGGSGMTFNTKCSFQL